MSEGLCVCIYVCLIIMGIFLQGTPKRAKYMSLVLVFTPLLIVQGVAIFFSLLKFVENFIVLLRSRDRATMGELFPYSNKIHDLCGFLDHGSRYKYSQPCRMHRKTNFILCMCCFLGYQTINLVCPFFKKVTRVVVNR